MVSRSSDKMPEAQQELRISIDSAAPTCVACNDANTTRLSTIFEIAFRTTCQNIARRYTSNVAMQLHKDGIVRATASSTLNGSRAGGAQGYFQFSGSIGAGKVKGFPSSCGGSDVLQRGSEGLAAGGVICMPRQKRLHGLLAAALFTGPIHQANPDWQPPAMCLRPEHGPRSAWLLIRGAAARGLRAIVGR